MNKFHRFAYSSRRNFLIAATLTMWFLTSIIGIPWLYAADQLPDIGKAIGILFLFLLGSVVWAHLMWPRLGQGRTPDTIGERR